MGEELPLLRIYNKTNKNITENDFYKLLYGKYYKNSNKNDQLFLLYWTLPLFIEAMNEYIIQSNTEKLLYNSIMYNNYKKYFKGFDEYVSEFMKYYDEFAEKNEKEFMEKYNDGSEFFRLDIK